jgi:hypothetical protein
VTHDIEDLVRRAQERQADRAAPPERILAALPTRARLARRRRAGTAGVLATAVVAVVAAVAVPTVVLRTGGSGAAEPGAPAEPAVPAVPAVPPPSIAVPPEKLPPPAVVDPEIADAPPPELAAMPLRYRPTWLPPGLAERSRNGWAGSEADPVDGPAVHRIWTARPIGAAGEAKGARVSFDVRAVVGPDDFQRNGGKPVTVRGGTGYYHDAGEKSYLEWRIDGERIASVSQHGLGLTERQLTRVADSVRPDTGRHLPPLRFDRLPRGTAALSLEITGNSASSWRSRTEVGMPAPGGGSSVLSVEYGTSTSATGGGERLTVGGRPARLVTRILPGGGQLRYLVVELPSRRLLTVVSEYLDREQLVTVAEGVRVTEPDLSWLGGRP